MSVINHFCLFLCTPLTPPPTPVFYNGIDGRGPLECSKGPLAPIQWLLFDGYYSMATIRWHDTERTKYRIVLKILPKLPLIMAFLRRINSNTIQ